MYVCMGVCMHALPWLPLLYGDNSLVYNRYKTCLYQNKVSKTEHHQQLIEENQKKKVWLTNMKVRMMQGRNREVMEDAWLEFTGRRVTLKHSAYFLWVLLSKTMITISLVGLNFRKNVEGPGKVRKDRHVCVLCLITGVTSHILMQSCCFFMCRVYHKCQAWDTPQQTGCVLLILRSLHPRLLALVLVLYR